MYYHWLPERTRSSASALVVSELAKGVVSVMARRRFGIVKVVVVVTCETWIMATD
jgi:hypothetical protein